jgi:hypothetical protein
MAPAKRDYFSRIAAFLAARDGTVEVEEILALFDVGSSTVKKYLKQYLDSHPADIPRVVGFYPAAETVISLAEQEIGPVNGGNLSSINLRCKQTIDAITKPKHRKFLDAFLNEYLAPDGTVIVSKDALVDFIYDEYIDFVHESDNGIVSIAGSMNEKILVRGFENAGLRIGNDFRKTGSNSEGDLQIEYRGANVTKILYCEVKSYAARERLLRGIQDIPHPEKIAVGFFIDADEFNPARTQTLLAAGPLAIYMPDTTFTKLDHRSVAQTTLRQDRLYRPLSMFINDMVHFKNHGTLPASRT